MLIWGFFISTVVLAHGTFTINSLAHVFGRRRYETNDDSRNSFTLAMVTLGEGWHNNHHHYPAAARNGFFWWEIDITYYALKVLEYCGIIWDLRKVPAELLNEDLLDEARVANARAAMSTSPAPATLSQAAGAKRSFGDIHVVLEGEAQENLETVQRRTTIAIAPVGAAVAASEPEPEAEPAP